MSLMQLLMTRGYFHADGPPPPPSSYDAPLPCYDATTANILVTQTDPKRYLTIKCAQRKLLELVEASGSLTIEQAAARLDLEKETVANRLWIVTIRDDTIICLPTQLWTKDFLEQAADDIVASISHKGGCILVSDVAQQYNVSLDDCRRLLTPRLATRDAQERRNDSAALMYVSQDYLQELQTRLLQILKSSDSVLHLPTLAQTHHWPLTWMRHVLEPSLPNLPGHLRGDDFVPYAYHQAQKAKVWESYKSNGFVTTNLCATVNMLPPQLKAVFRDGADCVVLEHCVIDYATIGVPMEGILQEAVEEFCELQPPPELLQFADDIQRFVAEYVLPNCPNTDGGTLTVTVDRILFVSSLFMAKIHTQVLPDLIQPLMELRAKAQLESDLVDEEPLFNSPDAIVTALLENFPALQVLQHDGDDDIVTNFVQTYILADETWQASCRQALATQVQRLERARGSVVPTSVAEVAFEDPACFATACHVIQMQHKFLVYAVKVGLSGEDRDLLEQEILDGCCRDFVRRLTLYLLDKHQVEDTVVTFVVRGQGGRESSSYGTPVDTALRRYPQVTVQCAQDESGQDCSLAEALTDAVPIQACKALGELDDATSVEEFLRLAEENCLTICGLPFRQNDKKSEKHYLAQRRQRLTELLQAAADPRDVLEYAIMLIYQNIKNQAVSGALLTGPILQKMVQERKVSEEVGQALTTLAESLNGEGVSVHRIDINLVEQVRKCGLAKDIAKHTLA